MSNKPKTNNPGDITKVSQMDVCQTPPYALEPLYPYLPIDVTIWESASGPEEILVNTLANKGYTVHATDLMHGEIFNRFTYKHGLTKWIEVTNMPFSIKYEWLTQAFSDGMPFALLAPYETTFAKEFQILALKYHWSPWPIEILSPERRINFKMPNMGWGITVWDEVKHKMVKKGDSAQMPTAWITWGLEVYKQRETSFYTYHVPMKTMKYNDDNTPKDK